MKRLAQKHNTVALAGLGPWSVDSETTALTVRPPSFLRATYCYLYVTLFFVPSSSVKNIVLL